MLSRHSLSSRLIISASLLTLPAGLTTGFSTAAHAQSIEDEIIVTATRRSESVQDIPINISAVGGEQIEKQGFGDLSELSAFVPGLNISDQGGRDGNRIVVRGLNAEAVENSPDALDNGGGTVATYLGEIPLFVDLRLNDLQRVEVLLGPQGTLYGAGTLGGAIRYIPNKPDFSGQLFEIRGGAYIYDGGGDVSTDTGFTFNAPLSDSFAIRGSLDFQDDKGFIDNPFIVQGIGVSEPDPDFADASAVAANFRPIDDANTEEIFSGRLAARWQPNDRLDATLTYYFQEGDFGGRNASSFRTGTVPSEEFELATRVPEPLERDSDLWALEIVADLGFAELTSATGFGSVEETGQRDQTDLLLSLDYSYEFFPTFTGFTAEEVEGDVFNQELRLVSTADARYNWIVGAYYNENETDFITSETTPGINDFAGFGSPFGDLEFFNAQRSRTEELAFFGEVGYDVTDNWDVTFGARYYDFSVDNASVTEFPFFGVDTVPFSLSDIDSSLPLVSDDPGEGDGVLYKFNTSYSFENGNSVYFTFSQGLRIGGANGADSDFCTDADLPTLTIDNNNCLLSVGQQFDPDDSTALTILGETIFEEDVTNNFEIGAKTSWLDGAVRLNGAVFFVDWDDPQVRATSINASIPITVNAESARSLGFELDGNWQVTDRFNLKGNFSFIDAELTSDVPGLIQTISTPGFDTLLVDGEDGDRLPGSPRTQFSVLGDYRHPVGNGSEIFLNGSYSYQSNVLSVTGGRGGSFTLPSFGRANVAVGYESDNWTFTLYSDNLFNDFSETGVADNPLFSQTLPAFDGDLNPSNVRSFRTNVLPPRSFGARFKYTFE